MKTSHLMHAGYWLLWFVWTIAWFCNHVMNAPDPRSGLFLIGIFCLGGGVCIFFPITQRKRITAYRNMSDYDSLLMAFAEFGLFSLCSTLFFVSADLLETVFQEFMKNFEMNLLPGILERSSYSVVLAYAGEVIGFYGINQGKVKFSFLRTLIGIVLFTMSLMQLS